MSKTNGSLSQTLCHYPKKATFGMHARVFNDVSLRSRMAKLMKMIWLHSRTLLLHISFSWISSIKVLKSPNAQLMV